MGEENATALGGQEAQASLSILGVHSSFLIVSLCMTVGNLLLIAAILHKKARYHDLLIIAGLAGGDLVYGQSTGTDAQSFS